MPYSCAARFDAMAAVARSPLALSIFTLPAVS